MLGRRLVLSAWEETGWVETAWVETVESEPSKTALGRTRSKAQSVIMEFVSKLNV